MLTDGYNRYKCDVQTCGALDYAKPDTDIADSYAVRTRIDREGQTHTLLLCSNHAQAYSQIVSACDSAYDEFEQSGEVAIHTAAEVEALTVQLQQLQSDYDAVRRNRDLWVTKYNALQAEYEQYKRDHPESEE